MKNMKISLKLTVSFVFMIALALIIGLAGLIGMVTMRGAASDLYHLNIMAIEAMGDLRELLATEQNDIRNLFLNREDSGLVTTTANKFSEYDRQADALFSMYEATIVDESVEKDYFAAKKLWQGEFSSMKSRVLELVKAGDYDSAYSLFQSSSGSINQMAGAFSDSAAMNNQWAKEDNDSISSLFTVLVIILAAALAASIIVAVILIGYISGLISKPVAFMKDVLLKIGTKGELRLADAEYRQAEEYANVKDEVGESMKMLLTTVARLSKIGDSLTLVADGDLTAEISLLSENDTMGMSLQKMISNLNGMFGEIQASTAQVSTGAKQIADGAQMLAQGSTQQASAVQQLSSSMSEISNKTKANADMAEDAADLAEKIMQNARKGSDQMDQMTLAVQEINEASQSISKVISVIDNIAFQTNILALNASVEAARAGQHGKGFAVVAEEVRALASKSAEAASDTSSLIANSMEKAELGAKIAGETASSLADIVSGIQESTKLVSDIAKSSEEQSHAISEINKGIDQVAQVVQQNSATAEQSAAASEEMSGQSNLLEELISRFKIKNNSSMRTIMPVRGGKQLPPANNSGYSSPASSSGHDFGKY